MKIKVSYEEEQEAKLILHLLSPILDGFKVKKSENRPPYKHLFFTPKNGGKAHEIRDLDLTPPHRL